MNNKITALAAATLFPALLLATPSVFAQYPDPPGGSGMLVNEAQLERCRELGIPEFTCTEQTLLARERMEKAEQENSYGSGTPLFGNNFGDMGLFIGVLAAIFGTVAAAFFGKSKMGKKTPI